MGWTKKNQGSGLMPGFFTPKSRFWNKIELLDKIKLLDEYTQQVDSSEGLIRASIQIDPDIVTNLF